MCEIDPNILSTIGLCKEELENAIVSNCGHPNATLVSLTTAESSSLQGSGYLSAIFPVLLKWSGQGADSLPASVIVKMPSAATLNPEHGDYSVDLDKFLPVAHGNECRAYEILAEIENMPVPKVYYSRVFSEKHGGLIIMDHLCDAQHWTVGKGATELQVKAMLNCFALLHAHIYAREDDTWKSGIYFKQDMFEKTCEALPRDMLPILEEKGGQRMKDALKKIPEDGLVKCAAAGAEAMENSAQIVGLPEVLVHGDVWSHNILWKPNAPGTGPSDKLCALIDWQLCHVGAPTEDITCLWIRFLLFSTHSYVHKQNVNTKHADLLSIGVSGEYRRKNIDSLLEYYHQNLSQLLTERGKEVPFTINQLKLGYKKTLELGVFFACFGVPLFITTGVETEKSGINFLLDTLIDLIEEAYG